jgi:hypothetical protein
MPTLTKIKDHKNDALRRCSYCDEEGEEEGPVFEHVGIINNKKTEVKVQCGCGFSTPFLPSMDEAWEFWDKMQEACKGIE